ncbi:MAG: Methyltransferase type 11 [Verrucomicrobiales bacterium]|nr:Methyltransferase type 11 [Verrucomicrobiales bacterium]
MAPLRKPYQGVTNIVRFNAPFFLIAAALSVGLLAACGFAPAGLRPWIGLALAAVILATVVPLAVSFVVYDRSGFYLLPWLDGWKNSAPRLVNIHSGFDETSAILSTLFPASPLTVLDFHDPAIHTESSIRRARAAYPAFPGTRPCTTGSLPLPDAESDLVLLTLAAHEIRNDEERQRFFREIRRVLAPDGRVFVVEHVRNSANVLAYHLGVFHFHPLKTWLLSFRAAGLLLHRQSRHTPFITVFELRHP